MVYERRPMIIQKTTLSKSIDIVSEKEQYDACCKKILAEKIILAWIMKHTIDVYETYDVQEIAEKYIEGNPHIADVSVFPDETNAPRVIGTGIEDNSVNEGSVTYDIQFRAIMPNSFEIVEMIINVEAQNDFYPGYPLIKRGIYYCGRMISSQYGTVFIKSHYEKLKKVYSIWICTNPPKERSNTITEYSFIEINRVGAVNEDKENYDLMTAIMICLGNDDNNSDDDLLSLLDVLLSSGRKVEEKKYILENKFGIPMTEEMEGEVERMCNLSDGVERKGIEMGMKKGMEKGKIEAFCELVKDNLLPIEEAAKRAGISVEEFRRIVEQ